MTRIFVEGKEDKHFIEKYLEFLSEKIELTAFEIIPIGGWTKLHLVKNKFKENSDSGGKNLLIFDADTDNNGGGLKKRLSELNTEKSKLDIEFEAFLLPNNAIDGDFELLLEKIINSDHAILLECYTKYEDCLSSSLINSEGTLRYNLPIRKAKIYSYVDAFPKSRKEQEAFKKGNFFYENPDIWNLECEFLEPLKKFLLMHVGPKI
ncbi:MAG TPA: DUF3226 domain-containing protein [Saprospiraceae bacterium]|nr:DUF3226 domain-containing protein [Saprospiraceae bacterium]